VCVCVCNSAYGSIKKAISLIRSWFLIVLDDAKWKSSREWKMNENV